MNSHQFDFDLGLSSRSSSSSRPLKDQKPNPVPSATKPPSAAAASWAHQPSTKPSWTHQPAPRSGLPNPPTSMVGDISGKSWTSAAPSSTSHIGIPDRNPKLFGDLVGSVLGQPKVSGGGANAPLKAAGPRNSYSMGSLSDSLPKSTGSTAAANNPVKPSWGSADNLRYYPSSNQGGDKIGIPMGGGGPSMKSNPASQTNPKKDPFESLMGFGSKNSMKPPSFQNAKRDDFGNLAQGFPAPPVNSSDHLSGTSDDYSFGAFKKAEFEDNGIPAQSFPAPTDRQEPLQSKTGADPLDMLFSSTTSTASATMAPSGESPMDEWDIGFGSGSVGGNGGDEGITELEGLPPPPAGVTATMAKTKGLDYYKQGQHPDAVKWLSWAVFLFEKSGDNDATVEILSCRASCYKEIANYKKAVADCSKVLEHDNMNVSVLLQRALLYESLEKYKLGAEDLRKVLKIEPHNRLANSTIHRMNKFSG